MRKLLLLSALCILFTPSLFSQAWMQYLPQGKPESELTFYDYQDAFNLWCREKGIDKEGYFINKHGERQKAYGWKQFKRWEIWMQGWYDPFSGVFLYESIGKEIARVYQERQMQTDNIYGNWTSVAYSEEGSANDGNGRINCIAFHPTNENIFWVGTAWGGVWKTTDHGATWTPISDFILTTGISSIAIPTDYDVTHTIYIGTGDRGYNIDYGRGILKSTDDGATWQETGFSYPTLQDLYINRMIYLPGSTTTLIACTNQGVFKSSDGFTTRDTLLICKGIDMEFKPGNSDIIYVSTRNRHGDSLTRVIRTVDAGINWDTVLAVGGPRTELAVSPDEPDWVYAVSGNGDNGLRGFYRSTNSGATFQLMEDEVNILCGNCDGSDEGGQAYYDLAIAASPLDAQTVFVGGVNIWKTTDGGANWSVAANGYHDCGVATNVHVDIHWVEFQYATDNLFVTSDGGIYYSLNNGVNYTNISGGLQINQPYRICSSQLTDEIIMGQQDNGIVLWEPGDVDYVGGGDGTDCVINSSDPDNQFFTNNSRFVTYTTNHWADRDVFITPGDTVNDWFKPIVVIPPSTVYYGGYDLWKSTLKGANMTKVKDFPDTTNIRRIAVSLYDPNVMMFFNSEHIWRTEDGGNVWVTRDYNLPTAVSQLTGIAIKGNDPNVVWVTFSGWHDQIEIYKSIDGGLNWFDFSDGLPVCPYSDIVQNVNQTAYDELYTVCYFGVYVKLGDNPWVLFSNGLPNVTSFDLDIKYGVPAKLRCATHGRGVWESNLYSPEATMPGIWTGVYSTDWHDNRNWQYLEVPASNENVTIPSGCPNNPHIYLGNGNCTNINIEQGAVLTISARRLYVGGNAEIDGKIKMVGTSAAVYVTGNITWKNDALFENAGTNCYFENLGDWMAEANCDVDLTGTTVTFKGSDFSVITNNSADFSFGDLAVDKIAPYSLSFGSSSESDLSVNGNLYISATSKFTQLAGKILEVKGNLDAQGYFFQHEGTYLCSRPVTINFATTNSYFNTLQIDHTGITEVLSEIEVRDTLKLNKGTLNIQNHELHLSGDLKRNTIGYITMTNGKVVFNGSTEQTIYNSINLQKVEMDILGDTLQVLVGLNVVIDTLQWSNGAVSISSGSMVYIGDLVNHGISGIYRVKSGATLNITNLDQSVNLNGKLIISGGTVNVYGGNTASYWPDAANAELQMTSGTLDFKDVGIFVRYHPTYTFTDNITGGVIRTSGDFMGDHTGFNPTGGVIELYGPDNAGLGHGVGSNFYKVVINKGATTDQADVLPEDPTDHPPAYATHKKSKPPSGKPGQKKTPPPAGTRANKVTVNDNLDIDNQLDITSGILDINGKTVNVASDVNITGTLTMTIGTSALNAGTSITWFPGSWANITAGTITFKNNWQFMNGTNAYLTGTNTVKAIGTALGNVYHKDTDAYFANFIAEKTSSSVYLDNVSLYPMRVNGDLTVKNGTTLRISLADLIVGGTFLTESSSTVLLQADGTVQSNNCTFKNTLNLVNGTSLTTNGLTVEGTLNLTDGGTVEAENFILSGTLDINAGSVTTHNYYGQFETGHLILDGGSFIIDKPYSGAYFGFAGITDLNGGLFEISYESVKFDPGTIVNILAGTFRIGGHFKAIEPNAFQPLYGAVEFINTTGSIIECNNGNYFHDVIINKSVGASPCTLAFATIIQNDLDIQSGQLSTSNNTLTVNENLEIQANGALSAGSSNINVGDEWINNRGTDGFLEGTSTVFLISGQTCTISPETFYRLEINKTTGFNQFVELASGSTLSILNKLTMTDGTLRMSQNSTLNLFGDLHIKSGAGLNANAFVTGTTVNCYGNWLDENTATSTQIGFHSGQSDFNLSGSNLQEMTANDTVTFYNLNMQKTGESFKPATSITVLGDYNHSTGHWSYSTTGLTHNFKGDFTISDPSLWQDQVNTVTFTGTSSQSITNSDAGYLNFGLMEVTKPEAEALTINSDLSLSNRLIINSGVAEIENHRLMCQNGLDVYSGGEINLTGDVSAYMGTDGSFRILGGHLDIGGTVNQHAHVSRASSGYYEFVVESGGTVTAEYTDFEYINSRGLHIYSDGNIGGEFPFQHCSFQHGESGGTLLQVNNTQEIVLHNVSFPANTWSGTSNVKKTNDAGNVTMANASGDFAGPNYEADGFSRIHWPATGTWEGDISSEWHDKDNWQYNYEYPNGSTDVVIPSGVPNFPILSQTECYINSLTIAGNANMSIFKDSLFVYTWVNNAGEINIGDENSNITALFCDSIVWQPGSTANIIDRGTFYITGNMLIRAGSGLNDLTGAWHFTGNDDSRLICRDTATINNLYNYKNAGYSLKLEGDTIAQLTINGLFRNGSDAVLECPSTQAWVFNGNFRNTDNGHIRCDNGTFILRGTISSANFRVKPGDYFNNLTIESLAKVNLYTTTGYSDTLRVKGNLVINPRTGGTSGLTANAFRILVWGDWINNVGTTAFSAMTSKVVFMDPSVPQNVEGNTIFYNLTAGDWETSAVNFYGQNTINNLFESVFTTNVFGTLNASQVNSDNDFAFLNVYDGGAVTISTFQQGAPVHVYDGTFTVADLLEDHVKGSYTIDEGLISLGQVYSPTASHDLYYSDITINGGELRFTGGNGLSQWPRIPGTASVNMSGGVFDLTNQDVVIQPTGFSENISGGMIRTFWGFSAEPAATSFHPTGGTVELYGTEDCSFSMPEPSCWFYNLYLSKTDGGGAYPSSSMRVKNEFRLKSGAYVETDGYLITVGP